MYACVCKAVTESDVRACHSAGMQSLRQVSSSTRAGTGCGQCVGRLRALLRATPESESAMAENVA